MPHQCGPHIDTSLSELPFSPIPARAGATEKSLKSEDFRRHLACFGRPARSQSVAEPLAGIRQPFRAWGRRPTAEREAVKTWSGWKPGLTSSISEKLRKRSPDPTSRSIASEGLCCKQHAPHTVLPPAMPHTGTTIAKRVLRLSAQCNSQGSQTADDARYAGLQ